MIKLKSLIVIILSSIVISAVIVSTIFGLSLYIRWKEGESARVHNQRLAVLNADIYKGLIEVEDLRARYERKGIYKDKCLIEGTLKNNGYRTVSSLRLAVDFLNESGGAIHAEEILPLKASAVPRKTTIAALSLFTSGREQPLLPGESVDFQHVLNEQKDKDITSPIKHRHYATNPKEWSGKFDYKVTEIRF